MTDIEQIKHSIDEEVRAFELLYQQTLMSDNALLHDVMQYIASKRGKQLRPLLVLHAAAICHSITDKTLHTAVALELLHTASLVHDDVVDNSPIRRGAEAIQMRWSNKVAILAGDYLLARVISIIAEIRNTRILQIISDLGSALSSGELLQLHTQQGMWIDEPSYFQIIEQKTARLFAACLEAGAESTGGSAKQVRALRQFGLQLGICFQLKDDILDYSDSDELGKPTMNDIRDGKATLPLLIAIKRASKSEAYAIRQLCESLPQLSAQEEFNAEQEIKNFVMRYDGIRYAQQQIEKHRLLAEEALSVFHDSIFKSNLLALLQFTINRIH